MNRLRCAAHDIDRELDHALISLGILPPLDLSEIRAWLCLDGTELCADANRDGHRIVTVLVGHRPVARIHHDGHVVVEDRPAPLATA